MLRESRIQAHHEALLAVKQSCFPRNSERSFRRSQTLTPPERWEGIGLRVVAGAFRVSHPLMDGRRQITHFLFPGDLIGLAGVREHNGSIEAVTQARAVLFPLEGHQGEEDADHPDLYRNLLTALQARLFVLGHKNAREKLAAFLLEMSARLSAGGDQIELPMSRPDIADYLCLSSETVCRHFTQFVSDGLIALPDATTVRILHRGALEFIGR